jgi:hypothetical protein
MMGKFYTCQHSVIKGRKMTAARFLSSAFLREERGDRKAPGLWSKAEVLAFNRFLKLL